MNAYVLGAGVSRSVGYPMGSGLFDEIDRYVRGTGACADWEGLQHWLRSNVNPTIVQACRSKNIEHLFTILDFATELGRTASLSAARASRGTDSEEAKRAVKAADTFDQEIQGYQEYRDMLLRALQNYLSWRHNEDYEESKSKKWDSLRAFAATLGPEDTVITFNYDATVERVLLDQGKWSPRDGYGFELFFQKSCGDKTPVPLDKSSVSILHLHGATGWYRRPPFAPGCEPQGSGAVSPEAFGAAPRETRISLDPRFLNALGLRYVDQCLPEAPGGGDEKHVVLHPSFLKDYETDESGSGIFKTLWRRAAEVLREAEHTYFIGYSMPKADVAALTLFLTTLRRGTVTVVNPDRKDVFRLNELFSGSQFGTTFTLTRWLNSGRPQRGGGDQP